MPYVDGLRFYDLADRQGSHDRSITHGWAGITVAQPNGVVWLDFRDESARIIGEAVLAATG